MPASLVWATVGTYCLNRTNHAPSTPTDHRFASTLYTLIADRTRSINFIAGFLSQRCTQAVLIDSGSCTSVMLRAKTRVKTPITVERMTIQEGNAVPRRKRPLELVRTYPTGMNGTTGEQENRKPAAEPHRTGTLGRRPNHELAVTLWTSLNFLHYECHDPQ
ncbi:uncharacterized protein LAESUDRAFT_728323 [Laetiporus sulphureus 93-53]|uniref:Uncharacterized protein n=1 Tax=Laetiporus sulphureus 93-53 TaxID=1314785 RepID=A0A165D4A5_9APHY|nr:uncharacterized protein LAESUDRAFT_728323 [Laetiporus sulphureus 93-53]KZT04127.1 hypothetical protein LAESUDRAFT_728323 [Laetiporus sulphureus 93-53]